MGYLQNADLLTDLWGNSVQYRYPGAPNNTGFDLWSFGADGRPGGVGEEADVTVTC